MKKLMILTILFINSAYAGLDEINEIYDRGYAIEIEITEELGHVLRAGKKSINVAKYKNGKYACWLMSDKEYDRDMIIKKGRVFVFPEKIHLAKKFPGGWFDFYSKESEISFNFFDRSHDKYEPLTITRLNQKCNLKFRIVERDWTGREI